MRHLLIISSLIVVLSAATPAPASADEKSQDFDNGPSVTRILDAAREGVKNSDEKPVAAQAATMPGMAPLTITLKNSGTPPTFGSVFGPFQPRVTQSQPYNDAKILLEPIKLLPEETQKPLLQQWKEINTIRGDLLKEAATLDQKDSQLYDDGLAINRETAALQARLDAYNQDVANYNQQCAGQPVNQFCTDWYSRLQRDGSKLSKDIATHNAAVDAWNSRYSNLAAEADTYKKKVDAWEVRIGTFSAAALKALDDSGRTTVIFQAQGDDIAAPGHTKSTKADIFGPLCEGAGEQKLAELTALLQPSELRQRDQAIARAVAWEQAVATAGGLHGPQPSKSFYNDAPSPANARIDIQVFRGHAFVPCPAVSH